jgi:nucleoside-diphosphate-sugar epimerase
VVNAEGRMRLALDVGGPTKFVYARRQRLRTMTSPILVTGGTGTLGQHLVPLLREAGCEVRVRSRPAGDGIEFVTGDLATGEGIEAAVDRAGTIVHCAGSSKGPPIGSPRTCR